MLTLTRKEGESIVLYTETGHRVLVKFDRITGEDRARISIDAPEQITILREELEGRDGRITFEPLDGMDCGI